MKVVKLLRPLEKVKDHLELLTAWLRYCLLTETCPDFWNVLAQSFSIVFKQTVVLICRYPEQLHINLVQ